MARTVIRMGTEGLRPSQWQPDVWSGNTVKMLPYRIAGGVKSSVDQGADVLADILPAEVANMAVTGVDVYGHSVRAQTIANCLRRHGTALASTIDPSRVRFLLAADPEHPYNGVVSTAQYGGLGVPSDLPFEVWWMTRQYDCVSDFPDNTLLWNSMVNMHPWFGPGSVPMGQAFWRVHLDYTNWPFFDPGGVDDGYRTWHHPNGKWHFVYALTYPLPALSGAVTSQWLRDQDQAIRAGALGTEAGYTSRPLALPLPDYTNLLSTGKPFPG